MSLRHAMDLTLWYWVPGLSPLPQVPLCVIIKVERTRGAVSTDFASAKVQSSHTGMQDWM